MLTLREVTKDGFGQKVRAWNNKELLKEWREHWAEHCNLELAKHGFDVRIDHRTLEAQGIPLEPQSKIGAKSAQIEMARLAEHQELAERNGERLLNDPSIVLNALTRQQSTFTHQDIARFVNRHSVGDEQFTAIYEKVKTHPEIVHVGKDDRQRDRYTTREMLKLETQMLEQAGALEKKPGHDISERKQERALENQSLSEEQKAAFVHLTKKGDMACVVGFAGTGKSYMLGVAREAWEKEGHNVCGMALSGIAAENLESGSGIKS
jgi:ATP-dependent exoDNAse (exonuclease V) alpha subunit